MTIPDDVVPDGAARDPALTEAALQLEAAIHDARVAFDCIGLGKLDRGHTSAVTARTSIDAAVVALQAALARHPAGGETRAPGRR